MTNFDIIHRTIQIVGIVFILFMVAGGGYSWRERISPDTVKTTILTMYPKLPPAPEGPSYCNFVEFGGRGLVLPCNFKPPFIGWLQGGKY
jgi:hypothetical protein